MPEEHVKAYTTTTDRIADWMVDYGQIEVDNPDYVRKLCEDMFPNALNIFTKAMREFSIDDPTQTVIYSPWVPYVNETISTKSPITLGTIRLEALLWHRQSDSGLLILGDKAIRLAAQSIRQEVPREMAVLTPSSLDVTLRGSGFRSASVADANAISGHIKQISKILLPSDTSNKAEKENDLAADKLRRNTHK